ncbi:MAG: MHYT domain-containing protein [Cyanobacteria bacterium P01_D01_bin.105]
MTPFLPTDYDVPLVILSLLIAVLAAYTALDLAGRVSASQGRSRVIWLLCGAIAMGTGIWSMHFIGMLAFRLAVPVHYSFGKVVLSILPAVVASGLALYIVSRPKLGWLKLAGGSFLMGNGIAAMHYTGMTAMETEAVMHYDVAIAMLSVVIAIAVSFAALMIIFKLREESAPNQAGKKILASLVMGAAIPLMHYTGMAAVCFIPSNEMPQSMLTTAPQAPSNGLLLVSAVVIGSLIIFSVAWISAFLDRKLSAQIQHSEALQVSKAKLKQQTQALSQTLIEVQSLQAQLVQSEKMSSIGQLVAGIAHEINNPVNFIHGNLRHVEGYTKDLLLLIGAYQQHYPQPVPALQATIEEIEPAFLQEDLPKVLASMRGGTNRIRDIVLSLRNFSRMDESDLKRVDIHEGIESTLMILQHRLKDSCQHLPIEICRDYDQLPLIDCYPGELNQVFMNVLVNAIDAIEEAIEDNASESTSDIEKEGQMEKDQMKKGQITIRTARAASDWVEIAIADNGPGIPDDVKPRIFDPFFTTKPIGKGTGLGMSISYKVIVDRHGGKIDVVSDAAQGSKFLIRLPMQQSLPSSD